jgi:D-amino-acid oxidase
MYLGHLLRTVEKLGAVHIKAALPTTHGLAGALSAAEKLIHKHYRVSNEKSDIWAFVNATGLSARHLVPDESVFPIRGHIVTVLGEASRITTINYHDGGPQTNPQITYIIPRPHSNTSIIGGTKQANNWSAEPDEKTTLEILERAKPWAWELLDINGKFQIVNTQIGLGPGRKDGPRVELEEVAGYRVCHCYGHAGAGMIKLQRSLLTVVTGRG